MFFCSLNYFQMMNAVRQIIYTEYRPAFTKIPVAIIADNISTHLNIGSVFRIADTFGASEVILCGKSPTPPHKLISRTARGAERHIPFRYFDKTIIAVQSLKAEGYRILALEITNTSADMRYYNFLLHEKIAFVVGSEEKGIAQEVLNEADECLHIASVGYCLSMNVATALAVAMYEAASQMRIMKDKI